MKDIINAVSYAVKHIEIYKLLMVILAFIIIKQLIILANRIIKLKETKTLSELKINNDAIDALDKIISDTLDEYKIFNLNIKSLDYISTKEEDALIEYLQENVPKRVPIILLKKLEYNINSDYIGTYIGKRIYMTALDFTLGFNTHLKDK